MPEIVCSTDSGLRQAQRNIINNAELRTNARKIHGIVRSARAPNTIMAYGPKQEEFRQFCRNKLYEDGDTVTEDKLLLWLAEDVTERPLRNHSRLSASNTATVRLSWRSVRLYVSAVTDLYRA
jgi:hypothetical protein